MPGEYNKQEGNRVKGVCKIMMDHCLEAGAMMDSKSGKVHKFKVPMEPKNCWHESIIASQL